MNLNDNVTSSSENERIENISMSDGKIILPENVVETDVNRNKPRRIVIRRNVSNGGGTNEDKQGENWNN